MLLWLADVKEIEYRQGCTHSDMIMFESKHTIIYLTGSELKLQCVIKATQFPNQNTYADLIQHILIKSIYFSIRGNITEICHWSDGNGEYCA